MNKMCWACTEQYDEALEVCSYCGEPRVKPKPEDKEEKKKKK